MDVGIDAVDDILPGLAAVLATDDAADLDGAVDVIGVVAADQHVAQMRRDEVDVVLPRPLGR